MSSAAKAHEPTMEEILASIRRIISDDEPTPSKPAAKAADVPAKSPSQKSEPVAPAAEPEPEPEVAMADLAQDDIDAMFAAMDASPAPEPAPKPAPASPVKLVEDDLDVLELTEEVVEKPEPAPAPVLRSLAPAPSQPAPRMADEADRLLSPGADEAVQAAFGTLANTILAGSARTLDDIVRDMLRPMLKAWLDDNLPPLVERLVRQEIERVARGGR